MHPTILDTLELAKTEHGKNNALDKGGKTPYYWHLLRVMLRIKNPSEDLLHIALLHDIVEDTDITLKDLKNLGYNDHIIECVRWCSRNMFPDLTFTEWMQKIGQEAPNDAVTIKISDISDNLGFERMNGLMNKSNGKEIKKKKSNHQYPMQLRIDKKVSKKMRLHGEMGVYDRYYKGWNNIFENQAHLPLIDNVILTDFCNLEQLKQLMLWLSKEDQKLYLESNKIHTWQISGELNIINDKVGQPYLALTVDNNIGLLYQDFLENNIEKSFIENQQKRDHHSFHITIINAMQYSTINKNVELSSIVKQFLGKSFNMFSYGIGSIESSKNDKQAWYAIMENMELNQWRNQFNITPQDFHMTLAFKNGDVFGQRKNRDTVVMKNSNIWEHWVSNNFSYSKNKKLKI